MRLLLGGRTRPKGRVTFAVTRGGVTTSVPSTPWQRFAAFIRRFPWR